MAVAFMRASTRKKRDLVMETALRMFVENGFENVSVDDIIAATGTSKGTFYHYFKSKDEIVAEMIRVRKETIDRWGDVPPSQVHSLEGHVNGLFLDLASSFSASRRLVRSMAALQLANTAVTEAQLDFLRQLEQRLLHWLPDKVKVALLIDTYSGTILNWSMQSSGDLLPLLRSNLALAWSGLRAQGEAAELIVSTHPKEEPRLKVAIIGGGLAGLTAAAYLSECTAIEGVLFERSPQLGGRAFTYEKMGFTLNYGAHAIYGIDRHTISDLEHELGLSFSSKQVDKRKVMYAKNGRLTPAPLDFVNLVKTDVLSAMQKVRFVGDITAVMANIHTLRNYRTLGDYLAESNAAEDLKELWEHLVCSNFFITPEDARNVPGPVIADYYHNLFLSQRPVNYVLGSWAVITNQLQRKIEHSGRWTISLREGVDGIRFENGQYLIKTKERETAFDRIVFAMPVQQVTKLLKGTPWEPFLAPYEGNTSTEVLVYDVGLTRVVGRPFSYISDMTNKMFITDVSATDTTLVPEGGQLLQGVAYLSDERFADEDARKAYLEERNTLMERLFDTHYPGWREAAAVKRVSKKAMVQSVKNVVTNKLLPNRVESMPFYFCGDGTTGKGELAERAFSSARAVGRMIAQEMYAPVGK